jgi:hypothetical protein
VSAIVEFIAAAAEISRVGFRCSAAGLSTWCRTAAATSPGVGPTGLAFGEYRFGDVLWMVAPFVGAFGTVKVLSSATAASVSTSTFAKDLSRRRRPRSGTSHSTGINLGAHTEFHIGAELDYRFENLSRLGIGFYHMSNAGGI